MDKPQGTQAPEPTGGPVPRGYGALRSIAPRLRAIILFGGSVRESALSRALGRSMLDLPLGEGRTILGAWAGHAATVAEVGGIASLALRVLVNGTASPPTTVPDAPRVKTTLESDRAELRGTGGLLRDLADQYQPDDLFLVANAYQVVAPSLADLAESLAAPMADVAILATTQHSPCGLELVRCGSLRAIKSKGFVDLKEQALPAIAEAFHVCAVLRPPGEVFPVRTLGGYLGALRALARPPGSEADDALDEDWFPTFGLVESSADVAPSARIHDSVVLRGAAVAPGAAVIRSLVCEGATVGPGLVVSDRIVVGVNARAERAR